MRRRVLLHVLAIAALFGCSSGSSGSEGAGASTAPGTATDPAAELLGFSAPVVGGGELDVAATYGATPLALWFWAPG